MFLKSNFDIRIDIRLDNGLKLTNLKILFTETYKSFKCCDIFDTADDIPMSFLHEMETIP